MSDEEDAEEPQSPMTVSGGRSGPEREDMVASYLPAEDDWLAKTHLDLDDPATVAALLQFGDLFPEVDDLQPVIDDFLYEFLRARTSVGGASREEYQQIFQSMYGGGPDDDSSGAMLAQAMGLHDDD